MPETHTQPPIGTRLRHVPRPPARRTIVAAAVTELIAVLEPVAPDPFIDGFDDVPRLWPTPHSKESLPHAPAV
jgi:hypothetical protein